MANEFVAKNGLISQNNSTVTGSLIVTGGITGSLQGTSSWANNSLTASFINPLRQDVQLSGSMFSTGSRFTFRTTGTVDAVTITGSTGAYANSIMTINGLNQGNQNGLRIINLGAGDSGILIQSSAGGDSVQFTPNQIYQTNRNFTFTTNNNAYDSSTVAFTFRDFNKPTLHYKSFLIQGSTTTFKSGSYFEVQKSGSIPILHLSGDAQSGSFSPNELYISGSLRVNSGNSVITGSLRVTNGITGSLQGTSSWANNAISSSYALTASYALTSGGGGGGGATFVGGTNVDNRIITATGTTPELDGEANLTFDGSILSVTGDVTANSFTGSLQGTASYATYSETSALTNNAYFAQGILAGDQSIPSATDEVIQFTDQFDPQGWWDAGTFQFLPTIAGYYRISLGVWFEQPNDNTIQLNVQIRSNSANQEMIIQQPGTTASSGISFFGTKIMYFNGSTDYIDFTAFQGTAGSIKIQQGSAAGSGTWFSAEFMTM